MSQLMDQRNGSAPTSPQFAATLQRAYVYAEEQAHRLVSAEHLLLALTEDPDCVAILRRKSIDLDHLRNEIAGLVSRNNDRFAPGDAGQPIYGADLLRILNTASGAASTRRPLDGALVLAALIADGQTPSAELIKLYGLTFEDAARVARPQAQPGIAHPPLATLRTAARESALGLRKRPNLMEAGDLDDEPLALPLPVTQQAPAQRAALLPAEPQYPAQNWDQPEPARLMNGNGHAGGHWEGGYPPGAPNSAWLVASAPPAAEAFAAPEWADYAYPDAEPERGGYSEPAANWQAEAPAPYVEPPAPPPNQRQRPAAAPQAQPSQPKTRGRKGAKSRRNMDRGVLTETIPRRLQVNVAVMVEARIGRSEIESLLGDFGSTGQPLAYGVPETQALTVRLRSPDGAIGIVAGSPETHWIDGALGLIDDDFASWRWTIAPISSGRTRLQLVVSARSLGQDGISSDVALPDQTIDVRVMANYATIARKMGGWIALVIAAGAAGVLSEHVLGLFGRLFGH